ncbi:hypothetical protein AX17_006275 [Amanita inopinata Kibby_2008]|nr:hypothetical protein AX17_006275 [Amanita inopinata Kibby_2008]
MEVLNPRAALLSNYEVLTLLHELDNEHVARNKTAHRIKKEESDVATSGGVNHIPTNVYGTLLEVSENLRTLEVEAIQYLSADYLPTNQQTPEGITQLIKNLVPYGLTKAEKLQVVNLAPTLPVELYVIVEELEDRIGDKMEEIISVVQSSLNPSNISNISEGLNGRLAQHGQVSGEVAYQQQNDWDALYDDDVGAIRDEAEFDDMGEGAGTQGDLEMEED